MYTMSSTQGSAADYYLLTYIYMNKFI